MKKNIIFGSLLLYFGCVVILIVIMLMSKNEIINIRDLNKYTESVTNLKNKINELETSDECSESLTNMLGRINDTHLTEEVSLEKYYNIYYKDDMIFTDYFYDVKSACELSDEETDNLAVDAINAIVFPEYIRLRYNYIHELKIVDYYTHNNMDKTYEEMGSYSSKYTEIRVLSDLIKLVGDKNE